MATIENNFKVKAGLIVSTTASVLSTASNALTVAGGASIGGNLVVQGTVQVNGTVTSIESTSVDIGTKVVYLSTLSNLAALQAQGSGIIVGTDPNITLSNTQTWASFLFDGVSNWSSRGGIYPYANNTYPLGSSSNAWSSLYAQTVVVKGLTTTTNGIMYVDASGTLRTTTATWNASTGQIIGSITTATTATYAGNLLGGAPGSLPYQTNINQTALLPLGIEGQVLAAGTGTLYWASLNGVTVSTATNFSGGGPGAIPFQLASGQTSYDDLYFRYSYPGSTASLLVTQNIVVQSGSSATSQVTGALQVTGGVGVTGAIYAGAIYSNGNAVLSSTGTNTGYVSAVLGGTDINVNTTTGVVTVSDISTFQSVTNRGNSTTNTIQILNTSISFSTQSGALVVTGGVGIGGTVYAGTIYSNGNQVLTSGGGGGGYVSSVSAGTDTAVTTSTGAVTVYSTATLQSVTSRGNTTTFPVYAGQLYDNNNRVVTSVVPTAGSGTSITNLVSTGTASSFTISSIDTLQLVTNRGNSTTNAIIISNTQSSTSSIANNALYVAGGIGANGGFNVNGNSKLTGNLYVTGLITGTNISLNTLIATSGTFYGNTIGANALYAGVASPFDTFSQTVIESAANSNSYMQNNLQNENPGNQASADWVATADNGTDLTGYIDMGITGSGWDGTQPASLGTVAGPVDGYLFVGQNPSPNTGNLLLATATTGSNIKFVVGIPNLVTLPTPSQVAMAVNKVGTASTSTTSGTLVVYGGVGIGGTVNVGGNIYINGNAVLTGSGTGTSYVTSISAGTDTAVTTSTGNVIVYSTATLQSITNRSNSTTNVIYANGLYDTNGRVVTSVTPTGSTYIGVSNVVTTGTATSFTINNLGVTNLTNSVGIGLSTGTGTVNVSNLGVTATVASSYIGVSSNTGSVTIINLGVQTLTAGTDTVVTSNTGTVTVYNTSTLQSVTNRGSTTSNAINITNTTQSTSTTTGALTVSGGLGVQGNIYGGTIYSNGQQVLTSGGGGGLGYVVSITAGTDTAVSTSSGNVVIWDTSTFQSITGRGATTTNAISITNTSASTTTVTANALYVAGGVGIGTSLYVTGQAVFSNNVIFNGTTTNVFSTNTVYTDNIIELHYPNTPGNVWSVNDGKDIGFRLHYYNGTDTNAGLVLANDTKYLEWYGSGVEDTTSTIKGTYGIFKTGGIVLTNTTATTSTTTGALSVAGGVGVGGDLQVGGSIYINGTPVGYGYTGSIGYTGSRGYTGSQGYAGSAGYWGSVGYTGSAGYWGSVGYTGSQGYAGSAGYNGSAGYWGSVGYTGSQGYAGSMGYWGSVGYTGSQGYAGSMGYWGSVGYTGSQGYAGSMGYWGSVGYTGSQGYAGSVGFTGSIGPQGPQGYTGSIGPQGPQGYTGSIGPQGPQGYTGSIGPQGPQGYTGSIGPQGPQGYTGSIGPQGPQGYTGSIGPQGPQGYTGSIGPQGYSGSQGYAGSVGYTGSIGPQGPQGYTGSIGYSGSAGPSNIISATNTVSNIVYPVMVQTLGSNQLALGSSNFYFNAATNSLYLGGDLYVDGTQTFINVTNIGSGDKTLTLSTSAGTAALAINSGLQIGNTATPYISFLFDGINSWKSSGNLIPNGTFGVGTSGTPWNTIYGTSVYDSGNRVVTSVTPSGSIGIGISGLTSTGPATSFTINNLGVTSITTGSTGISVSASTGSISISNTDTLQLVTTRGATTNNLVTFTNAINLSGALGVGASPSYGTSGQYLQSTGPGTPPQWNTVSATTVNVTQTSSGTTPQYMVFANTSTGAATLEANGPTGLVYIPTGNKFGIGTSAPADTDNYGGNNILDVYGPIYSRQSGSSNRMSFGVSGGVSYIDITAGLGLQTQISGGTVMNLDNLGNLQISTSWTSPQQGAKLSVQGGGYFSTIVTATSFVGTFNGPVSQIQTQANATNTTNYLTFVSANNASPTAQSVYTTSTHVINPSTGYIGIGTNNLVSPLNVYATQALGGTAGNYTPVFSTQASGGTGNNVYLQEWRTRASAGTDWTTQKITHGVWVDSSFTTPATSLTWHERYPNAGTQAWGNGATTFMFLNGSGYLGVGTTSPSYQLVVSNAGAQGLEFSPTGGINSGGFIQAYNRSGAAYFDLTYYASAHHWTNGGAEGMRFNSSGQLTIGTTSPYTTGGTAALTVYDAGAGSSPSIAVGASSSDEMYVRRLSAGNYQLQSVQSGGNAGSIQLQPYGGSVGVGTTTPGYTLQVVGSFAASTKSFVIDHPTKPNMELRYGSLEGPENGVYVRGRLTGYNRIELPDYWTKLVDSNTITVNLTPIGKHQKLYVEEISNNSVVIGNDNLFGKSIDCFYTVFGERCDVEKLVVEIQKPKV
jgi:collagen type VII alpha